MSGWNQGDLTFKSFINKVTTDQSKKFYEENGGVVFNTHASEIWLDSIPTTPPVSTTSVVEVNTTLYLIQDQSAGNSQTWFASTYGYGWSGLTTGQKATATATANITPSARLLDWIEDKYGSGYAVNLYDNSGTLVATGDASGWIFNYMTGILIFSSANMDSGTVSGRGPFKITAYRYIGNKGAGPGSVTSITAGTGLTGGTITSSGTIAVDETFGFTWTGTHTFNNPGGASGAPFVFGSATAPSVLASGQFWYDGTALNFRSGSTTYNLLDTLAVGGSVGGGTAGSVLFVDGSGDLGQDNTKFYWDDTNHYLGLGTNSLSARLTLSTATTTAGGILLGDTYLYRTGSSAIRLGGGLTVDTALSAASTNFSVSGASTTLGSTTITYAGSNPGPSLILQSRSADDNSSSVRVFQVMWSDNTIIAQITADGILRSKGKSFDIAHPTKPGKRLVYGSLEGPEFGAYDRGRASGIGEVVVVLPEHWGELVGDNYTVHLTSCGNYGVYCIAQDKNKFVVQRCGPSKARNKPLEFTYLAIGTRQDVHLTTEQ